MNILYRSHPSIRSLYFMRLVFKSVLSGILGAAILFGISFAGLYSHAIGIILAVLALSTAVFAIWAVRKSILYTVSSSGIRIDSGILNRKREEFGIRKIQSVDVQQNLIERFVLKTGDVAFDSAAGDMQTTPDILFRGVTHPHKVADIARNADDGAYGNSLDAFNQMRYGSGYAQQPSPSPYVANPGGYDRPPVPEYRPPQGL